MISSLCAYLVLCIIIVVESQTIYFNSSAPCAIQGVCSFADNDTWIGGLVPGIGGSVLIDSLDKPVSMVVDSKAGYVSLRNLRLNNTVYFVVEQGNLTVTNFVWNNSSTVTISQSYATFSVVMGYSMWITASHVNLRGSLVSLNFLSVEAQSSVITTDSGPFAFYVSLNISDSNITILQQYRAAKINTLYATGGVLLPRYLDVMNRAEFIGISNLNLDTITAQEEASLSIMDCPSSRISTIELGEFATLTYSSSDPTTTSHYLGALRPISISYLEIQDNINLTLSQILPYYYSQAISTELSMGEDSALIIGSGSTVRPGEIHPSATINIMQSLSFLDGEVNAAVHVARAGILSIAYLASTNTTFSSAGGNCRVTGPGGIVVNSGSFICEGNLTIGSVNVLGRSIEVPALSTLSLAGYGSLSGDVEVLEKLSLNVHPLIIEGDYIQSGGQINITASDTNIIMLQVEGRISMHDVSLYLFVGDLFEAEEETKFPLAKSEHFSGTFSIIQDTKYSDRHLMTTHEDEITYVEEKPKGYFQRNWQWLIMVGGLGGIVMLCALCIGCTCKDSTIFGEMETHDPHTTLSEYFSSMRLGNVGACLWVGMFFVLLIYGPLLIEAALVTLALGALVPLGFFIGLIEHRFVFLWAVLVLFIQAGGVLDLFADVSLVAKFFIMYFDSSFNITNPDEDKELHTEDTLVWIRLGLTLGGSLLSLIFLFFMTNIVGNFLDTLSGKKYFYGGKRSSLRINSDRGTAMLLLIVIMLWKLILMAFRVHLLFAVAKSLFTKRRLEQAVQRKVQWMEIILFFDLVWSGLPLGVLTGLELFERRFESQGETMFEMMKIGALAVDLVGASFLVYYVLLGLIKKVPCLHHHDHHDLPDHNKDDGHTEHHDDNKSKQQARISININDNTNARSPLLPKH